MFGDCEIDINGVGLEMNAGCEVITAVVIQDVGTETPLVVIISDRRDINKCPEIAAEAEIITDVCIYWGPEAGIVGDAPTVAKIPGQTSKSGRIVNVLVPARSHRGARIDTHDSFWSSQEHFEASAKDRVRRGP